MAGRQRGQVSCTDIKIRDTNWLPSKEGQTSSGNKFVDAL